MDCPNTGLGGTNGVQIKSGDDPKGIAKAVDKKSKSTDSVKLGKDTCTVSRADEWGSINYCIATIG
jgi:hypothetical protein